MNPLVIDVFTDIVCPWCLIGNRRLENALAGPDAPKDVVVRHHPFQLDPSTPPEGRNVPEMLRRKYGADPKQMFARVEAEAHASGIPLDLAKQPNSYPTLAAHTLVRHAATRGTQRALMDELFGAHFLEAKNVNDPATLGAIASGHGFDVDEAIALVQDRDELAKTRSETERASQMGISGVPFFVFGGKFAMSGCQQPEAFRAALAKATES